MLAPLNSLGVVAHHDGNPVSLDHSSLTEELREGFDLRVGLSIGDSLALVYDVVSVCELLATELGVSWEAWEERRSGRTFVESQKSRREGGRAL